MMLRFLLQIQKYFCELPLQKSLQITSKAESKFRFCLSVEVQGLLPIQKIISQKLVGTLRAFTIKHASLILDCQVWRIPFNIGE